MLINKKISHQEKNMAKIQIKLHTLNHKIYILTCQFSLIIVTL